MENIMGFRFRKSLSITKGVKVNLGKTGVGLSVGGPLGRVSVSKRGTTASVSIPKTGISYVHFIGKK
jgi:hypothetical protein